MYKCQECGKKFKSAKSAENACNNGCPKCGGSDIDLDIGPDKKPLGRYAQYLLDQQNKKS